MRDPAGVPKDCVDAVLYLLDGVLLDLGQAAVLDSKWQREVRHGGQGGLLSGGRRGQSGTASGQRPPGGDHRRAVVGYARMARSPRLG